MFHIIRKLDTKYNTLSQVAKVSIWYTLCSFLQRFISILTVPIITRIISPTNYGIYSVYSAWFEIIYNICTLALASGGYFVGMKKYSDIRTRYDSAVVGLCYFITTIIFCIFAIFNKLGTNVLSLPISCMLPMALGIIFGCPRDFWNTSQRYLQKYKSLVAVTLGVAILVPIAQILIIHWCKTDEKMGYMPVIWGEIIPSILFGLPILISIINKGKTLYDREIWRDTFRFNVVLIPYYLSITLLNQADRVMIERYVDAANAAYYSVAYRAASAINIFTVALNQSLMPWLFSKIKEGNNDRINKIVTPLLIAPFIGSFIISLIAPEIIIILSGKRYLAAANIIPSVAIGMCYRFVAQIFVDLELYYEKNRSITLTTIAIALLNIVLNWYYIRKFGTIAAGYTTLLCFIIQAAINCVIVIRSSNGQSIFSYKLIWLISSAVALMSLALTFLYSMALVRYILIVGILAIMIIKRKKIIELFQTIRK